MLFVGSISCPRDVAARKREIVRLQRHRLTKAKHELFYANNYDKIILS